MSSFQHFQITSPKGREMFSYLPGYYESSRVMQSDMDAKGTELDEFYKALDETLDQFFVRTATWGLDRWEQELGLTTELAKPLEQRRALVESKLRGAGQFSGRLVKNVAEAYDGGTVDVSFQPAEWSFTIKFVDTIGVPPNLDDLKMVIEEIKPAHLKVEYEFSYLLIRDMHGVMTLNQMEQIPLSKFAGGGPVGQ
ncbi:YmfQ family protein [Paenibacillus motobuensis]|uniref:YmfQ family protein n=1 Tax=Paenibacillus TaxID=44249 RepID=UPI002040E3CE|nr:MULTISPECIES: YmfQ family protein [Paenibacillus]MCM3040723.1 YmfQ family protein [Paenibacillus lutimineralis]MCM3647827.1 YmfQ family protein [Paenibacillus motobuensis]